MAFVVRRMIWLDVATRHVAHGHEFERRLNFTTRSHAGKCTVGPFERLKIWAWAAWGGAHCEEHRRGAEDDEEVREVHG